MNALVVVVVGWLGLNAAVLVGAAVLTWLRRDEEVHRDVHEILEQSRLDNDSHRAIIPADE